MRIDIITVLPELLEGFVRESILGRAQKNGLVEIRLTARDGLSNGFPPSRSFGHVLICFHAQSLRAIPAKR